MAYPWLAGAFFILFGPVFGVCQVERRAPVDNVHREVPRDLPATTSELPSLRIPAQTWQRNGFVSVQVNVDAMGNNIVGDAANEPSMAVDPLDPSKIVVGWRQFDSITSDFRQAGWAYSHDHGASWTFPGSIDAGVFRSDPVIAADGDGVFYYNSLTVVDGDFFCTVFKSFDGGMTWDAGTFAQGGDKQWMCIDRTDGIGRGNVYAAWNLAFSTCSGDFTASYDMGASFPECASMTNSPQWGTMTVGLGGEVYVAGTGFQVVKSSTIQDPKLPPQFDFSASVNLGGSTRTSSGPNPGGLLGQVVVDVNRSEGPYRGHVYLLASVDPPGADPLDVMFARSEDGGLNWSEPIRINDDGLDENAWQWFAMMAVAPNGRIDAVWNDTRNHPGSVVSELYYAFSEDGGDSWSHNQAVSPAFDPHLGWPQQQKIGDYYDMESDNLGADVIYTATLNGEEDVFYVRLEPIVEICEGDLNGDDLVDQLDFDLAVATWASMGSADIDGNGRVDVLDVLGLLSRFGPCP